MDVLSAGIATVEETLATGDLDSALVQLELLEVHTRGTNNDAMRRWVCTHLASLLRGCGRTGDAVSLLEEATRQCPGSDGALHNLFGLCLMDDGAPGSAVAAFRRAVAQEPGHPGPWVNLGNALRSIGDKSHAYDAYLTALECEYGYVPALYNLHATLYDQADPRPADVALQRVLDQDPDHLDARFYLGAMRGLHGGSAAVFDDLPLHCDFLRSSYEFARCHRDANTRLFADTFDTLRFALDRAGDGLLMELGVRRGTSLRWLAHRVSGAIHGFDAFEGLPDTWRDEPAGLYSTGGTLPHSLPDNAHVHPGWFRSVLPTFLAEHEGPIAFANVDCDLYGSTVEALSVLAPRIGPGAILVFDEYLCNPGWEDEEHRALSEVAAHHDWRYRYLAFSLFTKQAVVEIR